MSAATSERFNAAVLSFLEIVRDEPLPASFVQASDDRLSSEVLKAIAAGQFHVYVTSTVEEGIELLTGTPADVPDDSGHYPADTVFGAIEHRLERFLRVIAESGGGSRSR